MAFGGEAGNKLHMLLTFFLIFVFQARSCHSYHFPDGRAYGAARYAEEELQETNVHCSRGRSRTARGILDEYLAPFLEQEEYNLSTTCRLHPANDMFQEQEEQKDPLRPTQWHCGYCKKVFRAEAFLDKHFDNRHHDKIDPDPQRCLADVCGALHCDHVISEAKISKRKACNRAAVKRNKHLCESLANTCFPREESVKAMKLHEFFLRQFCDTHTCHSGQKHFPRGSGIHRNKSLFYAFSLFTIILLIIFYVAIYLYRKDMSVSTANLKRLAKHSVLKSQTSISKRL